MRPETEENDDNNDDYDQNEQKRVDQWRSLAQVAACRCMGKAGDAVSGPGLCIIIHVNLQLGWLLLSAASPARALGQHSQVGSVCKSFYKWWL